MKKILLSTAFLVGIFSLNIGQNVSAQCLNDDHYFETLEKEDPAAFLRAKEAIRMANSASMTPPLTKKKTVYQIPVVFHVVHEYGDENISKAQIIDQMRIINEDFRRMNADASNTRAIFQSVAADCEVEFVLARKDPQGNCTDGIVRIYSNLTNDARDNVKAVSYWPSDRYLNVWVVKTIQNSSKDPGVITLGYAQFPWDRASRPTTDGIVVRADYTGSIGTARANSAGRTATHEIGHWLGLLHTFQGGCNPPGWGEQIKDTPPVKESNSGCSLGINSCTNDFPDLPDQVENYMDYSNGSCMNMFSQGQKNVVVSVISAYRSLLVSSSNATFTGINASPSTCAPIADMTNVRSSLCQGGNISLMDLSYNGIPSTYTWTFEGGTPSMSNAKNPTVTYNTAGVFKVTLKVENASGSSTIVRDSMVAVYATISKYSAPVMESFEQGFFPPTDWNLSSTNSAIKWERTSLAASNGNSSVRVRISNLTPSNTSVQLDMMPLDLAIIKDPQLIFDLAYVKLTSTSIDRFRVYASNDCGISWVLIYQRAGTQMETGTTGTPSFVPNSNEWQSHMVNLKNYIGKRNILLRFEAVTDEGGNMYLDNINIGSISSIGESINTSTASIFPNPSNGQAQLTMETYEAGSLSLRIFDMSGKLVRVLDEVQTEPGIQEIKLNIEGLKSGVYLVESKLKGQKLTQKLIVAN